MKLKITYFSQRYIVRYYKCNFWVKFKFLLPWEIFRLSYPCLNLISSKVTRRLGQTCQKNKDGVRRLICGCQGIVFVVSDQTHKFPCFKFETRVSQKIKKLWMSFWPWSSMLQRWSRIVVLGWKFYSWIRKRYEICFFVAPIDWLRKEISKAHFVISRINGLVGLQAVNVENLWSHLSSCA